MEVSQEDLLKDFECDVDLTTEDSPAKKPKPVNAEKFDDTKRAMVVDAKWRAKEIFATSSYTISSDSDSGHEVREIDTTSYNYGVKGRKVKS